MHESLRKSVYRLAPSTRQTPLRPPECCIAPGLTDQYCCTALLPVWLWNCQATLPFLFHPPIHIGIDIDISGESRRVEPNCRHQTFLAWPKQVPSQPHYYQAGSTNLLPPLCHYYTTIPPPTDLSARPSPAGCFHSHHLTPLHSRIPPSSHPILLAGTRSRPSFV